MAKIANGFKLPVVILGYEPRKLFSVSDAAGKVMVPIFSNAEYARNYQLYFRGIKHDGVLTYVITEYDKIINIFEVIQIADPMVRYIAIDPMPPTKNNRSEKVKCYTIDEYLKILRECYAGLKIKHGLSPKVEPEDD